MKTPATVERPQGAGLSPMGDPLGSPSPARPLTHLCWARQKVKALGQTLMRPRPFAAPALSAQRCASSAGRDAAAEPLGQKPGALTPSRPSSLAHEAESGDRGGAETRPARFVAPIAPDSHLQPLGAWVIDRGFRHPHG